MWAPPSPPWAANPPPDQQRHEGYYPGTSPSLIAVGLFATILAMLVVCMRLYSRIFSVRGLKADDYLIVLATGFLLGFFVICARLTVYGAGMHIWDVFMADYSPGILQLTFFAQVIGCLMVSFNKLSVLSLYLTITTNQKFRAAVYTLMGIVVGFTLAYIFVQLLDCHPVEAQWDIKLAMNPQSCLDSDVSPMLVLSIVNILVDVAVVALPIPVILPLQLPKKEKVSCLLLFAAGGGLVCIAAIGRTVELGPLLEPRSIKLVDVTWLIVPELNWAFAEGSVGIIAASLPSVMPLFKRLLSRKRGTSNGENDGTGVSLENMSGGSRGSQAHKGQHWPESKDRTLRSNVQDEELGMCPGQGRSTQGSDRVSTVSENPNHSHARGGHVEARTEPRGRVEVTTADFAVAR